MTYPCTPPWSSSHLTSHLRVFPEGQFVAVDSETGRVLGMAASLIIQWNDDSIKASWRELTMYGFFTNHDPVHGCTLYGAEIIVHPDARGTGIGGLLYDARRRLAARKSIRRIRAGARLRGYHQYADAWTPLAYVEAVVRGEIRDPTLTFQLHQGFRVIAVVSDFLVNDPESLGCAAVIEWQGDTAASRS